MRKFQGMKMLLRLLLLLLGIVFIVHFTTANTLVDEDIQKLMDVCYAPLDGLTYVITNEYVAAENSAELYLESCYPIEISTSQGARSMGHCMDFIQYVYYAGARLSPSFNNSVYEKKVQKCPDSIFLHGEFPERVLFNLSAKNYWMPNVEQVHKLQEDLIPLTSKFIAKSRHSKNVLLHYLTDNHINIPVIHFGHSSLDIFYSGPDITPDYNAFFHSFGHSGLKGTKQLLDCWIKHPEWPRITILGNNNDFYDSYPDNIKVIGSMVTPEELRVLQLSHGVHICPSIREGFGHYINQARASKALVVTTDFGPMNEFVTPNSGVLIPYEKINPEELETRFLPGIQVGISPSAICMAVEQVLAMSLAERKQKANLGRVYYEMEREEMIMSLKKLKTDISNKRSH